MLDKSKIGSSFSILHFLGICH